jgi:hypothetical protein
MAKFSLTSPGSDANLASATGGRSDGIASPALHPQHLRNNELGGFFMRDLGRLTEVASRNAKPAKAVRGRVESEPLQGQKFAKANSAESWVKTTMARLSEQANKRQGAGQ